MNENLNLVEILKNVPKGTKLWSPVMGDVEFRRVNNDPESNYPIVIADKEGHTDVFTADGRFAYAYPGECMLFPSKEQRDWSQFKVETVKPKVKVTLHPFDRVLGRDEDPNSRWSIDFFSHYDESDENYPCKCTAYRWMQVIPYNEWTAQLLGTTDECPIDYELDYSKGCRL